jgi:two-component system, NarL family, nitrate/nitrite response regulator NarL
MVRGADLKKITARFPGLSTRKQQITELACDGLSNKAIANRLSLSEGTIKIHLHHIYKKLNIDSRKVLLALALSRPNRP